MTAVLLMVMKNRDKQNTSKPNHHPKMACKTAGLRRQCEVWVCIAAAQRGANKPSFSIGSTWKREDFPGFGVDMHWNCGCFYTISIYIPKFHSRICENISSARWKMMEQLGNIETACTDFIRFLERCSLPCLKLGYPDSHELDTCISTFHHEVVVIPNFWTDPNLWNMVYVHL